MNLSNKNITNIVSSDFSMAWSINDTKGKIYIWGIKGILIPLEIDIGMSVT